MCKVSTCDTIKDPLIIKTTAINKLILPRSNSEYPSTISKTQSQKYAASEMTLNKLSQIGRYSVAIVIFFILARISLTIMIIVIFDFTATAHCSGLHY